MGLAGRRCRRDHGGGYGLAGRLLAFAGNVVAIPVQVEQIDPRNDDGKVLLVYMNGAVSRATGAVFFGTLAGRQAPL